MDIDFPKDMKMSWDRDFSFFVTDTISEHHVNDLPKYLGKGYGMCLFIYRPAKISFYRSESSEELFDANVGNKCINEAGYSETLANNLNKFTDSLKDFFVKEKVLSAGNVNELYNLLGEHFAYHLGVYYGADFIASNNSDGKHSDLLDILIKAREYNEDIYPVFEEWVAKQQEPLSFLTMKEAKQFIELGTLPADSEIEQRKEIAFVYRNEDGSSYISSGEQATKDAKELEKIADGNLEESHSVIKGVAANKGCYTGKVRLIKDFKEFKDIKPGEVIVTTTTRPDYNQYIMKAGAIVGDERSLLSHTAIVAREFNIPCVVGTKIATKVLKNGDVVKVDANKGVITKL